MSGLQLVALDLPRTLQGGPQAHLACTKARRAEGRTKEGAVVMLGVEFDVFEGGKLDVFVPD